MTQKAQQIAIAEACGYAREVRIVPTWEFTDYNGGGEYVKKETVGYAIGGKWLMPESLPDYLNDLNAMRQAELHNWHDEDFIERYENELQMTYVRHCGYSAAAYWWMSSAKIRAEAFLRTLNLWK
jgi:hypothetical protein